MSDKRNRSCSCFQSAPCDWCMSLTEAEIDVYASGGMNALYEFWRTHDEITVDAIQHCSEEPQPSETDILQLFPEIQS